MTERLPLAVASAVAGHGAITIRRARPADGSALRRLEGLSDRRLPETPLLVAELDGEIVAATPASGGEVVSDPFSVTIDVSELLRLRSRQLLAAA